MRLRYLDVLKAFAIIAVVLYHSGFMPFGYLGVDMFLVINGYLITKGLEYKMLSICKLSGSGGYFGFELSRIVRLLPPLIIAGIVCMAVGFFVMIDDTYESLSQSVIATNFFGNNVIELIATGDYWAADKLFSPLMHTWYVGLVMQFYLVYPIIFYIAKYDKYTPHKTLLLLLSFLGVLSLLVYLSDIDTAAKFYLLPARFFEFAVGGVVAILYNPDEKNSFNKYFVYFGYVLLLILLGLKLDSVPANVKLLAVVSLSCLMICSKDVLENKVTGNLILAKFGAASYSIFIWHQIVLAFFRSFFGSHFTLISYALCLVIVGLLSWISYCFIEQRTGVLLKSDHGKKRFYLVYGTLFLALTSFAGLVYKNAGVVRDIPELGVSLINPERGKWPKYNNRIMKLDKPFETDKLHWFVIGNSFGRDFGNIILESNISDSVEISYCGIKEFAQNKYENRFEKSDKIFVASKGLTEDDVRKIELLALAFGHSLDDVIVVGEKFFGETMTEVYVRRFLSDYYSSSVTLKEGMLNKNEAFRNKYGSRFIDLLEMNRCEENRVKVFTDEHEFISSDCIHLTQMGAKYFAKKIEWNKYLK